MHSNINSPLELSADGTIIEAHGPILDWEDHEEAATITIAIAQKGVFAIGTGSYKKPADRWTMTLVATNGGEFDSGRAKGTGSAVVNLKGNATEPYSWTKPVKLEG